MWCVEKEEGRLFGGGGRGGVLGWEVGAGLIFGAWCDADGAEVGSPDLFVFEPVLVEGVSDIAALHGLDGALGHAVAEVVVCDEFDEAFDPGLGVACGEYEAGFAVSDDGLGSALVGDECGEGGGLCFHDGLSEGVGGGGEDEGVGGGVDGGEFDAVAEAEEDGTLGFECGFHFFSVGAVADDDEFGVDAACSGAFADGGPGACEEGEVFLDGDAAAVEDADGFGELGVGGVAHVDAEAFPDGVVFVVVSEV